MKVHIVAPEADETRLLYRLAKALADGTDWTMGRAPIAGADLNYLLPYFTACATPFGGYFTHREDTIPSKVRVWNAQARRAKVRIVTAQQYYDELQGYGPTFLVTPPLDREKFNLKPRRYGLEGDLYAGVSGFVYTGGRKGETILASILQDPHGAGHQFKWRATGRGWPVRSWAPRGPRSQLIPWQGYEDFYHGLDVYVCTATIEGVPYPPLEALACGVPIIIPKGVGLLDTLPSLPYIVRYEAGDARDLERALDQMRELLPTLTHADRQSLRDTTARFTPEAWAEGHMKALVEGLQLATPTFKPTAYKEQQEKAYDSSRGIYVVAYGDPARKCAIKLIESVKTFMPDVPVAVASDKPLSGADVNVMYPDEDLGGRTAKTKMWELAPAPWETVLYLDADTELTANVSFLFEALEQGWELVLTKDVDGYDLIRSLWRRDSEEKRLGLESAVGHDEALQLAGGVVGFRRTPEVQSFLENWFVEWKVMARRDQGALVRSLYANPLRVLVLGNEWNSFTGIFKGETAGIIHHRGGPARRLQGWRAGRLDDKEAWQSVLNKGGRNVSNNELAQYVGAIAIQEKGLFIGKAQAEEIAGMFEGDDLDRQYVITIMTQYGERPLRLRKDGFHNGCRQCGKLINYCKCSYGAKVWGTSLR